MMTHRGPGMTLGQRIQLCRKRAGLTQETAAQLKGCSVETWRRWEQDEWLVTLADCVDIARILRVNRFKLLDPTARLPDEAETDSHWSDGVFRLIAVVCVATVAIGCVYVFYDRHKWENWCHSAGGHVTAKVTGSLPYNSPLNGGTVPTKTSYCFTSDGRLLGSHQA